MKRKIQLKKQNRKINSKFSFHWENENYYALFA